MDQLLPKEVIHMVFIHLEPRTITDARLVCKRFAEVGLYYLRSSYHLVFNKASFELLSEISRHPVVSRCIKTIFYEADNLFEFNDYESWKNQIFSYLRCAEAKEIRRPLLITQVDSRVDLEAAYKRLGPGRIDGLSKGVYGSLFYVDRNLAEQHMLRAYEVYKQYLVEQKEMQMREYNARLISDIFKRLTNLKSVKMSLSRFLDAAHLRSTHKAEAFKPTLHSPWGDHARTRPLGVAQLDSILHGVLDIDLKIEQLHCGYIHWKFFKESDEHFDRYKLAIRFLKRLRLHMSNWSALWNPEEDMDKRPDPQNLIECVNFFANGRLQEFTTAAPQLMELAIDFDYHAPVSPARLSDIVGSFTWPALRSVHFSYITVNEGALLDFFTRHATSLKEVSLAFLKLGSGDWTSVFRQMAKVLQLEKTVLLRDFQQGQILWEFDVHTRLVYRVKYVPDVATMWHCFYSHWGVDPASDEQNLELSDLERLVKAQEDIVRCAHPW